MGNTEAERAVQTVKRLLKKADDPYVALMNYRATPLSNGCSPLGLLFSRRIKTLVPINPAKLKPRTVKQRNLRRKENAARSSEKQHYDMRKRARVLQPLQKGDNVFVKRFQVDGKVLQEADRPRSYIVDTPRGVISRNRRHLVKLNRDVQLNEPTNLPTGVKTQNSLIVMGQIFGLYQPTENLIHPRLSLSKIYKICKMVNRT